MPHLSGNLQILFYGAIALVLATVRLTYRLRPSQQDKSSAFALVSLFLSAASLVLAVSSILYARKIGGFPHYDPLLLRIFFWGFGLSLTAVIIALVGVRRRTTIRWIVLALSLGTLFFWFASMLGE